MKNLVTLFTIVIPMLTANSMYAQKPDIEKMMSFPDANFYAIRDSLKTYYSFTLDSLEVEDDEQAKFNRWEWFWNYRSERGDDGVKTGSFKYANLAMASYLQNPICNTTSTILSNWEPLGPFSQPNPVNAQNMGIIISVFVDPNDHNNIFAGSNSGGFFKTTDGGLTWSNPDVSRLPAMGVISIVVAPGTNNQTIYIATGMGVMGRGEYGLGVLKSTDGGAHWAQTALTVTPANLYADFSIRKIVMDPNDPNTLFAIIDKYMKY